jgi:crossover junction endodeoxyribonuclease RuvC
MRDDADASDPSPLAAKARPLRPGARRALGVDPGSARLGFAVVEEYRSSLTLLTCGCIETPKTMEMPQRLLQLYQELSEVVETYGPREMAVEELFFAKNVTTIIAVGQARGVALLVAANAGLPVSEYKPMHIKQAVHGYGLAEKKQVGEMVKVLLGLPAVPKPDDAADAAAVAICHLHTSHLAQRV